MNENLNQLLDDTDFKLLSLLQQDASKTFQVLADQVGISTATCQRRVQRMKDQGVIQAQVAVLSEQQMKAHGVSLLQAVVEVTLDQQTHAHLEIFERHASADQSVQQVYRVSGGPDFVLIVCVPDMAGYQDFAARVLSGAVNVRNVRCYFVTQRAKMGVALPLLT